MYLEYISEKIMEINDIKKELKKYVKEVFEVLKNKKWGVKWLKK